MLNLKWQDAQDDKGHSTREFIISREGRRDITGALWLPEKSKPGSTLVCFGHGASGNRYQAPISHLAYRFSHEATLAVLSIDGPVHGLRQSGDGARGAFFPEFQREHCIEEMTEEWSCAIKLIQSLPEVGIGKIAYFGLSMGSLFGIPLIASRDDVIVATLGLMGIEDNFPHSEELSAASRKITCPLLFLMQLEDELFPRQGYLKAFDLFTSQDKRLHCNPGLHSEVPAEEINFAFDFMLNKIVHNK